MMMHGLANPEFKKNMSIKFTQLHYSEFLTQKALSVVAKKYTALANSKCKHWFYFNCIIINLCKKET
jgi:hypothetical protein